MQSPIHPTAAWPASLPHPEENEFITVVVHADSIRWALHVRVENHFRAQYWWRYVGLVGRRGETASLILYTLSLMIIRMHCLFPSITKRTVGIAMLDDDDEKTGLIDLLPPFLHPWFTGNHDGPNAIAEWCHVKRIPFWTVYIMDVLSKDNDNTNANANTTVDHAAETLQHIFQSIPCRLFTLQWSDFFPRQSPTSHVPLTLLSSLKAAVTDAKEEHGSLPLSVLVLDTKDSHLQYAACDGTKVLGYGVGPSCDTLVSSAPQHAFSLSQQPHETSSYFQVLGIVNAWEQQQQQQRYKGTYQRHHQQQVIWIEGDDYAKIVHSLLVQASTTNNSSRSKKHTTNNTNTNIQVIRDLVHFGVDAMIQEQTKKHGELSEPADRLFVGQRVIFETTALGTVMNHIPRNKKCTMLEYQYNVEFDHGKRHQVLTIQQVVGTSCSTRPHHSRR